MGLGSSNRRDRARAGRFVMECPGSAGRSDGSDLARGGEGRTDICTQLAVIAHSILP